LNDRRAVGEYQPRTRGRRPDGPPVPGYFPAAVTEEEYGAAQAGADKRRKKGSGGKERKAHRIGKHVNLFAGLVKNARDGDDYIAATKPVRVLVNARSQAGGGRAYSIPLLVFEAGLLDRMKEINPREILNGDGGPDESLVLAGRLAAVEAELDAIDADVAANGYNPAAGRRSAELHERKVDLTARLAQARQEALHPLSETWGECKTLLDALHSAADPADARLRLRAALRRMVSGVWLLVVPRGRTRTRLAAVQVFFAGGGRRRDYLIHYVAAGRGRKGVEKRKGYWQVRSWTGDDLRRACLPEQFNLTSEGPTVIGEDEEGRQAVVSGWQDVERDLQALSTEDLDRLVFGGIERHPLP
jgi:hypothetical protein